ncbi:MAG: glutamine amidotransferase [Limisphaerales bacterium]
MTEFGHHFDWRFIAAAVLLALLIIASSYATARRAGWPLRIFLITLRFAAFIAVLLFFLDLQRVEKVSHAQPAAVAVVFDDSRSMALTDGGSVSRLDQCKRWIAPMLETMPSNTVVHTYATSSNTTSPEGLDWIKPTATSTPLGDALERVLIDPAAEPLSAIVLCSDGIENTGKPATAVARLARRRGIPIFTLATGSTNAVRDIALTGLQVKRTATEEAPVAVTVEIASKGFENHTVPIEVRCRGDVIAATQLKLTGAAQTLSLEFVPKELGFNQYEIAIAPQKGEWLESNNRRIFGVNVISSDLRIIYMEGTPNEWHYLRDAVESEGHIKVEGRYPTKDYPKSLNEMLKYDVIINSDIKKEVFTDQQLKDTVRFVEEFGGGFAMVGGFSAFGSGGYQRTVIDSLIPVAMEQHTDVSSTSFKPAFPAGALDHPIMQIGATKEENETIWTSKFPPFSGYNLVDRAKPGAIVLAHNPNVQTASGPMVFLAVQEVGKGRTMAFTSDTTAGWGTDFETIWGEPVNPAFPVSKSNCDSRYYRRFWMNAIRWLAAGKAAQHKNAVLLQLAKAYCHPNEAVTATVDVQLPNGTGPKNAKVSLLLTNGKATKTVNAKYDSTTGHWTAELQQQPGSFTVTATAMAGGVTIGHDKQLLVCEDTDLEMSEVRAAPEVMTRIAELSGGQTLTADTTSRQALMSKFKSSIPETVEYHRTPIWSRWGYLMLVVGLLTTEWIARRTRGLA